MSKILNNHIFSDWNHIGVDAVTVIGETQNEATTRKYQQCIGLM